MTVENYFAPEDKVSEKIIARLSKAQKTIDFMAFSFTDDTIGKAVMDRAKAGVRVRGVFETTSFTQNADQENDENLMIVDDANLAQAFTVEFGRVYEQAKNPPQK